MGKQTCRANKRVTFTVIVERVNSPCQLLNLLGTEALYEVSIGLVNGVWQGTKIGALIPYKKMIKNGKKKKCFLFSYVYIT